jgi:hypothetical protein
MQQALQQRYVLTTTAVADMSQVVLSILACEFTAYFFGDWVLTPIMF